MKIFLFLLFSLYSTLLFSQTKNMKFSDDWFSKRTSDWEIHLKKIKNKDNINYLEVGVYEGFSFFWVMDNILTGKNTKAYAVDIFLPKYEKKFLSNLSLHPNKKKVIVKKGLSENVLKNLPVNFFDLIYIDGSHKGKDVYIDAALSWLILKEGGILIFDDYLWYNKIYPLEIRPQGAIDAFLTLFASELELIHRDWQVFIRKKKRITHDVSTVGNYMIDWRHNIIVHKESRKRIDSLTTYEFKMLKELFIRRKMGEVYINLKRYNTKNGPYSFLCKKLQVCE